MFLQANTMQIACISNAKQHRLSDGKLLEWKMNPKHCVIWWTNYKIWINVTSTFQLCLISQFISRKLIVCFILVSLQVHSQKSASRNNIGIFGLKKEVFFLNLEDGYFGCQVNESTDYLQLYELSKLCDGTQDCFLGSDELSRHLKCTSEYLLKF